MDAPNETSLSAGRVIRELLQADKAVRATGADVFPVYRDKALLPYVYYRRAGLTTAQAKGAPAADTATMELMCCAASYEASVRLAEAVRAALDGAQARDESLRMRSCYLADADELWEADAYVQRLIFTVKI